MKKKKNKQHADDRTLRERIRQAAGSVKERAKGMNSEEKENVAKEAAGEQTAAQAERLF